MKKNRMNKVKGMLAVMMMACMLLTLGNVNSNAEYEVMPCGETLEKTGDELL